MENAISRERLKTVRNILVVYLPHLLVKSVSLIPNSNSISDLNIAKKIDEQFWSTADAFKAEI
jgi:hypothetical protein